MLQEKFDENPNLRGAIRDVTKDSPIEEFEVGISEVAAELLERNFIQNDRVNLWLEWNGINKSRYPTFESYIHRQIRARDINESFRKELEKEAEEERMRF